MTPGLLGTLAPPADWRIEPLRRVARRRNEVGRPELEPLSVFLDEGVVPRASRQDNYNVLGADLSKYLVVRPGDLVFNKLRTWQGGIGVSNYWGIVSPAYFVCTPDPRFVNSRYLHHLLRSHLYLAELTRISKWMPPAQFDIGWEDLRLLPVLLPPPPLQRRIGASLDREAARTATIIAALTRLRDLGLRREQATVDSTIASCSDRVPMKRLVDFKEGPGIMAEDFRDDGIPLIRVSGLKEGRVTLEGCNFLDPHTVARRWRQFVLEEGDYLLSASASMGLISRVGPEAAGSIPYTGLIRLRPKAAAINMRFARYFFASSAFLKQIDALRTGVGIEHYGPTHLGMIWMPIASPTEQQGIADRLDLFVQRTQSITRSITMEIRLLRERMRALTTAAVTGHI